MSLENIADRIIQLNENFYPTVSLHNDLLNIFIESTDPIHPINLANELDEIVRDYYYFTRRHIYFNSAQNTLNIRYKEIQ